MLNMDKCVCKTKEIKVVRHVINGEGVKPDPVKVASIQELPEPNNITELCSFLGMVNQLGKFLPELASTIEPL